MIEAEPLETSFGEDVYRQIFADEDNKLGEMETALAGDTGPRLSAA